MLFPSADTVPHAPWYKQGAVTPWLIYLGRFKSGSCGLSTELCFYIFAHLVRILTQFLCFWWNGSGISSMCSISSKVFRSFTLTLQYFKRKEIFPQLVVAVIAYRFPWYNELISWEYRPLLVLWLCHIIALLALAKAYTISRIPNPEFLPHINNSMIDSSGCHDNKTGSFFRVGGSARIQINL